MPEAAEEAVEAKEKDRTVALVIAVLALLLAFAEAGAKKAQHLSIEKNIEASDLFNFYQAKKIRSTVLETAGQSLDVSKLSNPDPKYQEAAAKLLNELKTTVANFEHDPKKPEDSLDKIQERATAAVEARELANRRLEHYELGSGLAQIAIVLASAAIITTVSALMWMSIGLGAIGAIILGIGFLAPYALPFFGG